MCIRSNWLPRKNALRSDNTCGPLDTAHDLANKHKIQQKSTLSKRKPFQQKDGEKLFGLAPQLSEEHFTSGYIPNLAIKATTSESHHLSRQPTHQATILKPTDEKMATKPMDTTTGPPAASTDPSQSQNKRQKTSHSQSTPATKPSTLQTLTLRSPPWSYIHLQQIHHNQASQQTPLDPLTVHLHLTQALHTFLGLHGAAIPIDILKLDSESESSSSGEEQSGGLWIRVPSQDRAALLAAVGGWVGKGGEGWRVLGWSSWGIGGGRDGGRDLFG